MKFMVIPALSPEACESELNQFLRSHRVLAVERTFVELGQGSFWAICVDYQPSTNPDTKSKRARVDYREVLSPDEFGIFVRLRELRSSIASRDAVPVYTIFTNEQLAEMVRREIRDEQGLATIPGIGDARAKKYGAEFLQLLMASDGRTQDETGGKTI